MTYFSPEDHSILLSTGMADNTNENLERIHRRMVDLHRQLYSNVKSYGLSLFPNPEVPGGVSHQSNCSTFITPSVSLIYTRSEREALNVERIMGREGLEPHEGVKSRLHPVIELRVAPDYFTVELIVAPDAWYDQQNFVGKMSIQQHRTRFLELLSSLQSDYMLGFWSGIHVGDMVLHTKQLPPTRVLFEFLDTFAAGRDYFRLGRWYMPGEEAINSEHMMVEAFDRIRDLFSIYQFMLWTSNNNFHSFYKKAISRHNI